MAKYQLRIKARELRSKGESVKSIALALNISKGTVSLWVRDIILSIGQLEKLRQHSLKGAERGRLKSALLQKRKRIRKQQEYAKAGKNTISSLSYREFFLSGLALYWGEGSKKTRIVQFCNSDVKLINFMVNWLKICFNIPLDELTATVGINQIHREREITVKEYWSNQTGIPLDQFRKTSFKKSVVRKVYANYNDHFGTLSIKTLRSTIIYYKILGLIEALAEAGMKPAFRDVS